MFQNLKEQKIAFSDCSQRLKSWGAVSSVTDSVYNMFFRFNDDTLEDIPISLKEKDEDIVDFVYIENGKIKKLISNLEI